MSNNASNPFDRLVFPSDTKQFGVWKDLIVGHLRQKSAAMRREALVKGLVEPAFAYEDLLRTSCEIPRPMDTDDAEAQRTYKWQLANLSEQDTYIRSLLNQTLPRSYMESLRVSFNDESLPVAWKRLETVFGQSNAQGMAAMIARFDEALAMDFASVGELILRVKEARNRINRQSREALDGVTMIPNQHEDAVSWYKKGLELHPDNAELQTGLKEARVAVLNDLLEGSEEEDEEEDSEGDEQLAQNYTDETYLESVQANHIADENGSLRSTQIVQRAQTYASSRVSEVLANENGDQKVSAAVRVSRLAAFASRVRKDGVFANAQDIPDHLAHAFLVAKDSSLIIDGVRYIRESAQFQDLHASIVNWWRGDDVRITRQKLS
ncbi:uncharacterized protein IUM83_06223 [Phytophthora cinnamomi]|uniref:uncharacterized protein n=1 Tax=Phytophthora cinnamomi TaxID=4785 RepID=UPI00355A95AA|nr:hypothetical protein IUM83_06223 [Phytophthora cinnamomi]